MGFTQAICNRGKKEKRAKGKKKIIYLQWNYCCHSLNSKFKRKTYFHRLNEKPSRSNTPQRIGKNRDKHVSIGFKGLFGQHPLISKFYRYSNVPTASCESLVSDAFIVLFIYSLTSPALWIKTTWTRKHFLISSDYTKVDRTCLNLYIVFWGWKFNARSLLYRSWMEAFHGSTQITVFLEQQGITKNTLGVLEVG